MLIGNIKNKTIILLIIINSFFCSNSVVAQSSKALETIFAIEALDLATANLKNAKNANKRINSLSQAIQSYEETLAILRISVGRIYMPVLVHLTSNYTFIEQKLYVIHRDMGRITRYFLYDPNTFIPINHTITICVS